MSANKNVSNLHINELIADQLETLQEKYPIKIDAVVDKDNIVVGYQVNLFVDQKPNFKDKLMQYVSQFTNIDHLQSQTISELKNWVKQNDIKELSLEDVRRFAEYTIGNEAKEMSKILGQQLNSNYYVASFWEKESAKTIKESFQNDFQQITSVIKNLNSKYLNDKTKALQDELNQMEKDGVEVRDLLKPFEFNVVFDRNEVVKTIYEKPTYMVISDKVDTKTLGAITNTWFSDVTKANNTMESYLSLSQVFNQVLNYAIHNEKCDLLQNDVELLAQQWLEAEQNSMENNALTRLMVQQGVTIETILNREAFKEFYENVNDDVKENLVAMASIMDQMDIRPEEGEPIINAAMFYHTKMSFGDALTLNVASAILNGEVPGLNRKLLHEYKDTIITLNEPQMQMANDGQYIYHVYPVNLNKVDILLSNVEAMNSEYNESVQTRYEHLFNYMRCIRNNEETLHCAENKIFGNSEQPFNLTVNNPVIAEQLHNSAATFVSDFSMEKLAKTLKNNQSLKKR